MRADLESDSAARWASDAAWPRTRWELSAPASYVLLHGPKASGAEAFKLAMLELVTKGVLRLTKTHRKRAFGRRQTISLLAAGPHPAPVDVPELWSVYTLFRGLTPATFPDGDSGSPVADLARYARAHFGSINNYTERAVVRTLVNRGLFVPESYRILWIVPATRHVLTAEGQAAQAELRQRLDIAERHFHGWIDSDLARAAAFVSLAGASLLLVQSLYPDLQHLYQELALARAADSSGTSSSDAGSSWHNEPGDGEVVALAGGLDFSGLHLDFDFDLSALDNLGDAFSAIDSGVDSGGDSGGGDGGGDGGGGD